MTIYRVHDRTDDYEAFCSTKEKAMINAINHCVTEGLMVKAIEETMIIYVDPDTTFYEIITITPISVE